MNIMVAIPKKLSGGSGFGQ